MNTEDESALRRVFQDLAQRIARWELAAGTRLTERELSEHYGVSRTPVREALLLLNQMALVERGRAGFSVRAQTLAEIDHIYQVRIVLEELSVEMATAAVGTPEFDALMEQTRKVTEMPSTDVPGSREHFHEQLAALTGNRHLSRLLDDIDLRIQGYRRLDLADPEQARLAQAQHLDILTLISAGEVEKAKALVRRHIELSQSTVRKLLKAGVTGLSFES